MLKTVSHMVVSAGGHGLGPRHVAVSLLTTQPLARNA